MQYFTGFRMVDLADTTLETFVDVLQKVKERNAKEIHEENDDNEQRLDDGLAAVHHYRRRKNSAGRDY